MHHVPIRVRQLDTGVKRYYMIDKVDSTSNGRIFNGAVIVILNDSPFKVALS